MSVVEARQRLRSLLDEVAGGEEVAVLRRGKEVARIVPPKAPLTPLAESPLLPTLHRPSRGANEHLGRPGARGRTTLIERRHYRLARDWMAQRTAPLRTLDALHLVVAAAEGLALPTVDCTMLRWGRLLEVRVMPVGPSKGSSRGAS